MSDETSFISRQELERVFNPRAARSFEDMQRRVAETEEAVTSGVAATETLDQGTFVTLSPNTALANEFVLSLGDGLSFLVDVGTVTILSDAPRITGGHSLAFVVTGPTSVALPLSGTLATRANTETLTNKTLTTPALSGLADYADDAAASAGGVPLLGTYRTGSIVKVRVA